MSVLIFHYVPPRVQIWDDKSSLNLPQPIGGLTALLGGSREGMMETHDEVTRAYFNGSEVHCEMLQRSGGKGNRLADGTVAAAFFTHHQKAIVCDAPPLPGAPSPHRRLVAFLGGLDLTLGAHACTPCICTMHLAGGLAVQVAIPLPPPAPPCLLLLTPIPWQGDDW